MILGYKLSLLHIYLGSFLRLILETSNNNKTC